MKYFTIEAVLSIACETREEAERIAESLHDKTGATRPDGVVLLVEDGVTLVYDDDARGVTA